MNAVFFIFGIFLGSFATFIFFRKKWFREQVLENELIQLTQRHEAEVQMFKQSLDFQRQQFNEMQQLSQSQFEILAQKILDEKTRQFKEQNEVNFNQLLTPLKEQIGQFQKTLIEKFQIETQERFMLKGEIDRLIQMHDKIATEASALSKALKGDNKFQGDWGELVLERILESSGLRPDQEYIIQSSYQNDVGDRVRPDVIIKLPENRHIIIDSKVSLKSFEAFQNSDSDSERQKFLQDHIKSIEDHVKSLSSKGYEKIPELVTPDFVFLFVPIEPAWLLALKGKPGLGAWAWDKGVAIVTASTLFTSLRTVANLWRFDRQNKNSQQIAKEAGALYDKFVGFIEEFDRLGHQILDLQKIFETAKGRLTSGKGNVIMKIENLRLMGAKCSKQINSDWLNQSSEDES